MNDVYQESEILPKEKLLPKVCRRILEVGMFVASLKKIRPVKYVNNWRLFLRFWCLWLLFSLFTFPHCERFEGRGNQGAKWNTTPIETRKRYRLCLSPWLTGAGIPQEHCIENSNVELHKAVAEELSSFLHTIISVIPLAAKKCLLFHNLFAMPVKRLYYFHVDGSYVFS